MASSYMPPAASADSSRNGEPGSISRITRSRGRSFPRATCRSRARAEPPSAACARRLRSSSTSAPMRAALSRKSCPCVSMLEAMATRPSPCESAARATMARAGREWNGLCPDFLALEDDVADHIEHDRARDQPDRLRPSDDDALAQRQRRATYHALDLIEKQRPERAHIRIEHGRNRVAIKCAGRNTRKRELPHQRIRRLQPEHGVADVG